MTEVSVTLAILASRYKLCSKRKRVPEELSTPQARFIAKTAQKTACIEALSRAYSEGTGLQEFKRIKTDGGLKGKQNLESVSHDVASKDVRPKDPLGAFNLRMKMTGVVLKKIIKTTIVPPAKVSASAVLSSATHDKAAQEFTSTLVREIQVKDGQIVHLQSKLAASSNSHSAATESTRMFQLLSRRQQDIIWDQSAALEKVQQAVRQLQTAPPVRVAENPGQPLAQLLPAFAPLPMTPQLLPPVTSQPPLHAIPRASGPPPHPVTETAGALVESAPRRYPQPELWEVNRKPTSIDKEQAKQFQENHFRVVQKAGDTANTMKGTTGGERNRSTTFCSHGEGCGLNSNAGPRSENVKHCAQMWIQRKKGKKTLVSPSKKVGYIQFPMLQYPAQKPLLLKSEKADDCYKHYTRHPKIGVYQEEVVLSPDGDTGSGVYLVPSLSAIPPTGTYPYGVELSVNQVIIAEAQEKDLIRYANEAYSSKPTGPIRAAWLGQAQRMEGCKNPDCKHGRWNFNT
jgi:hypothetical protein